MARDINRQFHKEQKQITNINHIYTLITEINNRRMQMKFLLFLSYCQRWNIDKKIEKEVEK